MPSGASETKSGRLEESFLGHSQTGTLVCKLVLRYPNILKRVEGGVRLHVIPLLPVLAVETWPWSTRDTSAVANFNWVSIYCANYANESSNYI